MEAKMTVRCIRCQMNFLKPLWCYKTRPLFASIIRQPHIIYSAIQQS